MIPIFDPDNIRIKSKIRLNLNISKLYEANLFLDATIVKVYSPEMMVKISSNLRDIWSSTDNFCVTCCSEQHNGGDTVYMPYVRWCRGKRIPDNAQSIDNSLRQSGTLVRKSYILLVKSYIKSSNFIRFS